MEPLGNLARDLFAAPAEGEAGEVRTCAACGRRHDLAGVPADVKFRCLHCGTEVQPVPAPARIGKYVIVRRIARGGMGTVYEAEDPELKRRVALKVIREDDADPQTIARFPREAAIAAQLQHPHIVAIHDVGLSRDALGQVTHFIAMDLVEGVTLADLVRERRDVAGRDALLRMVEEVARAAGYAHSKGVVHRDLKPANVLVDGEGRVRLTDFGLARAEGFQTRLTGPQAVMGTPPYMAPEQVRGGTRESDARTDVYALGVMLYEVLTGRVPFMAESAGELYRKISQDEPSRPGSGDRTIPRDLDVICLKALEKDPARRYVDGQDFADDLARFRKGEAIQARPPSLFYRLRKRVARRRVPAAILLVSILTIGGILAWLVPALREQERKTREVRTGQMRTLLATALELRRVGRPDRMKSHADEVRRIGRQMILETPDSAEPHYIVGRVYRALLMDEDARRQQESALEKEPGYPAALYEQIVLGVRRYRARLDEIEEELRSEEGMARAEALRRLAPEQPSLVLLRREAARDLQTWTAKLGPADPRLGSAERNCAAGLLAWMTGDTKAARGLLEQALKEQSSLEEGYEALATLELEGRNNEAALRWWSAGLAVDAGYLPFLEGRAETLERQAAEVWNERGDPHLCFTEAIVAYSAAIGKDPGRALLVMKRGRARLDQASAQIAEDGKGGALLAEAIEDFNRALALDPGLGRALAGRARAHHQEAVTAASRGEAAAPFFEAAEKDFSEALARIPSSHGLLMLRGNSRSAWAGHLMSKGGDPSGRFDAALADLDAARAIDPKCDETLAVRGRTRALRGIWVHARGQDPTADYEKAIADFDECVKIGFGDESMLVWLGRTCGNLAQFRVSRMLEVESLGPFYRKAEQALEGALKINPGSADAHRYQGVNYNNWAVFLEKTRPENVKAKFQKALDHLNEAVRLKPALAADPQVARAIEQCRQKADSGRDH